MWGSLARGITATVRDIADDVGAGDVLEAGRRAARRVGEVVAPPIHDDDEDDDYDEYDEDEDDNDDVDVDGDEDQGEYYIDDQIISGENNEQQQRPQPTTSFDDVEQAVSDPALRQILKTMKDIVEKDDSVSGKGRGGRGETSHNILPMNGKMRGEVQATVNEEEEEDVEQQQNEEDYNISMMEEKEREEEERRIEEERLMVEEATAREKKAKTKEMERQRLVVESKRKEQERLKAAEAVATENADFERVERERTERERLMMEKTRLEEEARMKRKADELEKKEKELLFIAQEQKRKEEEEVELEQQKKKVSLLKEKKRQEEQEEARRKEEERIVATAEHERQSEEQRLIEIKKQRRLEEEELFRLGTKRAAEEVAVAAMKHTDEREKLEIENSIEHDHTRDADETDNVNHKLLERELDDAREVVKQVARVQDERNQLEQSNKELQILCEQLQDDLHRASESISSLKEDVAGKDEQDRLRWEHETRRAEEEESNLLAATKIDMELQITNIRESMQSQIDMLESELSEERSMSVKQQHDLQRQLEEVTSRLSATESETLALASKKEAKTMKQLAALEKTAAKALASLEKKEVELAQLQQTITDLRETMTKTKIEGEEAEEEMDELHHENEELNQQLVKLQKENKDMQAKLDTMSDDSEKVDGLKVELQMLEEELQREKSALELANAQTSDDKAMVITERDELSARVSNLEQLLAAARGDLEIANIDRNRAMLASENLSRALEDLQNERDAEIALLSEQHETTSDAIAAAHAASLEATREACAAEMRDVQYATDRSVQNALTEMDNMESTIQECRRDNMNLRKALDEAISRLQSDQEDVIDRSLIKNIILDWHSKRGKAKQDVMILLGSILHFTEDEKDKAFIADGPGTLGKVYDAVAAPLPPPKLNVDKIEGDNVREKWVNFLLAETGDEELEIKIG